MENLGHIMVDIETMGNQSYSSILSIGAVEFNIEGGYGNREFYRNVDLKSCMDEGLVCDPDTIFWWMQQEKEAMEHLKTPPPIHIREALVDFANFITECGGLEVDLWGNSARFDLGILQNAYRKLNMVLPWNFRRERCVRTLLFLNPNEKENTKFEGIRHNAIDDCKFQIEYCSNIYRRIKWGT